MENLKKYITGIICCLCAILLMSHNTYAADLSQSVSFINSGAGVMYIMSDNNSGLSCLNSCHISQNTNADQTVGIRYIYASIPNGTYYSDNIWQLDFVVWKVNAAASLHTVVNSIYVNSTNYRLVSADYDMFDTNTGVIHIYVKMTNTFTASGSSIEIKSNEPGSTFILLLNPSERISYSTWTLWKTETLDIDTSGIISAIQAQPNYTQNLNNISNSISNVNDSIEDVKDAIENQNQEEQEAVQDASDEAATEADENSTNQQTSNLIGVLQNFLSAITNFSGTDCNISLAFPSYAGGNMNVNVCQNKDKAGNIIGVFTSLTLIVFYLPLALKLLSMIYNEIRSFTNG